MFFGMSRSLGTLQPPWQWIANAALLVQFPLAHSLLLTKRGRALLTRLAPGRTGNTLSSTTYVIIGSVQVFALFALWSPSGELWWRAQGTALFALTTLYAGSWLLLGKAMSDAGLGLQLGALGWVALLRNRNAIYPKMPETGLFRLTRQPIYVAFTLILWTVPTWTPDQLGVALVLTSYCVVAPLFKEARYRQIYGSAFETYARSIPYWLPWPRKPSLGDFDKDDATDRAIRPAD
ncbi:isoprenylcysteine carboxylmethyltransferase family protein [Mycobacterium sp. OTB74]|uniref:methyltransferase family protein n=1 Tax=Mycobacterium sp. OTB74 TaxID=1853452 RepID=UPI0024772D38|nr:isoprenylcysteine carboxylmethyltransferase family protein [Mycobacterium sp. OTB74]